MRKMEISPKVHSTLTLALLGWTARCKAEAEQMEKWAVEYGEKGENQTADKCRANAAASRRFIVEADEALEAIR